MLRGKLHKKTPPGSFCRATQKTDKVRNRPWGCMKGPQPLHYEIRRTGFAGLRDRSLPRPVGETGRRSVGNRKERHQRDYASSPEGYSLLPISFGVCPQGAREMMYFAPLTAARMRKQTCSDCYAMKPGMNSGPYTMNRNTTIRHSR